MAYSAKQTERFWNNVTIGGPMECWPWQLSQNSKGYGQVSLNGRVLKAHKVAWEMKHGRELDKGARVSHICEEPGCCNPNHLEALTPAAPPKIEPTTSQARGERHGAARLTDDQARAIKYRMTTLSTKDIASLLGVEYSSVWDIRKGRTWRHI